MPLLATKFHIHAVRANSVSRPHLVKRLNLGLNRKLTVLSAPAGFGKTSLIGEWVSDLQSDGHSDDRVPNHVAWLSLDANDNNYVGFFTCVVNALQSIDAEELPLSLVGSTTMEMLCLPHPPSADEVLTNVVNQLSTLAYRIILVLDDYHVVDNRTVHDALNFFIEHMPPNVHLVISSRDDPPLPLARLRALDEMSEFRATDLRFSFEEVGKFLNGTMGLNLAPNHVALLETRTEGWVAGLQLSAVSLRGVDDIDEQITAFSGSHRHIVDYLLQEVLTRQPDGLRTFLLQTSILRKFSGSLCGAVTGRDDAQAILEQLERSNLFIVPLDERREWYRYHHLFSDLLQQQLLKNPEAEILALHLNAAGWYYANCFFDEAIEHALDGKDFQLAAQIIEEQAEGEWERGDLTYWRWTTQLPDELLHDRPFLCILRAYVLGTSGESPEKVQSCLSIVEGVISRDPDQTPRLLGRVAAIRAFIDSFRGDIDGIIQHADQALRLLPESDVTWRSLASIAAGDVHGYRGDMNAAMQARKDAAIACQAAGATYHTIGANLKIAITLREQGHLRPTIELCQQQVDLAGEHGLSGSILSGWALAVIGETLCEMNEIQQAMELSTRGVQLAMGSYNLAIAGWAILCHIRVLFSSGEYEEARRMIDESGALTPGGASPPWGASQIVVWMIRLLIAQGNHDDATDLANAFGLMDGDLPPKNIDFFTLNNCVAAARILLVQSKFDQAANLLTCLLKRAEEGQRISSVIEILVIQALVHQAAGRLDEALQSILRAVDLAEPEGFVRLFVDEGPPLARLLFEAVTRDHSQKYASHILSIIPESYSPYSEETSESSMELFEPLSTRELEVLSLVGEGLGNQDIGTKLFISTHTVKAHVRSIFAKLDAHTRTEAVAKARAFGLRLSD